MCWISYKNTSQVDLVVSIVYLRGIISKLSFCREFWVYSWAEKFPVQSIGKQLINQTNRLDAVIRRIKCGFKRQNNFFIIISDFLERRQFSCTDIIAQHGFCHLNIYFFISSRCNKVHLAASSGGDASVYTSGSTTVSPPFMVRMAFFISASSAKIASTSAFFWLA